MTVRFTYECTATPQYAALYDVESERRTSVNPHRLNRRYDDVVADLTDQGYVCVDRTPRGRQSRLTTVYDYEALTTPAFVLSISF